MATALACGQFHTLGGEDCDARIRAAKRRLGSRRVIPGHSRQRDEAFRRADFSGDSLRPLRRQQISILLSLAAGCSMADMAAPTAVERAWKGLRRVALQRMLDVSP